MSNQVTESAILKQNAIAMAKQHKDNCNDEECTISVSLIGVLLTKAGIPLSKEEWAELI